MRLELTAAILALLPFFCEGQSDPVTSSIAPDPIAGNTGVKDLTPAELAAMLSTSKVFVYDCNEPDMYSEAHVPGAVLTVYDEVTPENLPSDHGVPMVFYCYSPECPAGGNAARTAVKLGFTNVYCMIAGITGWQDAGLKTEP